MFPVQKQNEPIVSDMLSRTGGYFSGNTGNPFKTAELRDFVLLMRRRQNLIMYVTVACVVLALLTSLLLTPIYRAEAVTMIELHSQSKSDESAVLSSLTASAEVIRSEMDIIQSRTVIDRVIEKLHLVDDKEFGTTRSVLSYINPMNWLPDGLSDEERHARAISKVADNITKRLKVDNDGRSYSIHIYFDSKSAKKAALIANTFADEYLVDELEAKYEATARANKWLNERLEALKNKVQDSEQAVADFREKSKLIEVGQTGQTVAAKQMEDMNNQLGDARVATAQAEAKLRSVKELISSKNDIDSAADVLASPLIQNLREQEAEVRRNEAELASKYGPLHPKMVNARAQYAEAQAKIAEEVHKVVNGLQNEVDIAHNKETQLEEQLHEMEKRSTVENKDSVELRQLQREADANRSLYESFLTRFKETSEQADMQAPDSRIIARADVPNDPNFPKKILFAIIGLFFGGVLGVVVAYLVEYFDSGYRSAKQIEDGTGIPVIGVVPDLDGVTQLAPEDYVVEKPMSSYGEALRTVRTAIHFSNVDRPPKVIMVTSSTPAEGKTTFCLSLARVLASGGNKILLIDADMRRSYVSKALGMGELNGWSCSASRR